MTVEFLNQKIDSDNCILMSLEIAKLKNQLKEKESEKYYFDFFIEECAVKLLEDANDALEIEQPEPSTAIERIKYALKEIEKRIDA